MKIGGLQPFSLCDYPESVSAVVFTQGCNFQCPFCHNGALIPPSPIVGPLLPEDEVLDFLDQHRGKLDGVVISGGEPTLQPDLTVFAKKVKAMGLLLKLDTNGSNPSMLRRLLSERLLDFVAMDLKAPLHLYARLAGKIVAQKSLIESVRLISESGLNHEFRTTFVSALLDSNDVREIQAMVPSGSPYRLQECRLEHSLDPALRRLAGHTGNNSKNGSYPILFQKI